MHQWHLATLLGGNSSGRESTHKKHGHPYPVDVKGFISIAKTSLCLSTMAHLKPRFIENVAWPQKRHLTAFSVDLDRYGMLTFVEITAQKRAQFLLALNRRHRSPRMFIYHALVSDLATASFSTIVKCRENLSAFTFNSTFADASQSM